MGKLKDLSNQRFGRLVAIKQVNLEHRRIYWKCICDCENKVIIRSDGLIGGGSKSCGCLRKENLLKAITTHGQSKTRFYHIWESMYGRCINKNDHVYKYYGGRGIKIYDRWLKFENFRDDMYKSYLEHVKEFGEKETTIDRKDCDGNYESKNCRWATWKEQLNNTRRNKFLTYNGVTKTYTEWTKKLGFSVSLISKRVKKGWVAEKILTTPAKKYNYGKRKVIS